MCDLSSAQTQAKPKPGREAPLEILQAGGRQKDGFPLFTAARLGQTDQTQCAFTILFPIKLITRPLDLCAAGYGLLLRFNLRAILKGEAQRLSTVTSSQGYAGSLFVVCLLRGQFSYGGTDGTSHSAHIPRWRQMCLPV